MRVALVCGTYAPERDGVADYVRRLAEELPAAGVQPVVAARTDDLDVPADGVSRVTAAWSIRQLPRAARALDRLGCDLIHVQYAPSAYGFSPAVGWLPGRLRTPLVTTLHEYGWWSWPARVPERAWRRVEYSGRYDRESGLLAPRSRAVLTTNAGHARGVRQRLGRASDVVPIGPNVPGPSVDRPTAAARVRGRLGLSPELPLLVFFGFVHPVKGVRELIDAVALLEEQGRPVRAIVAGGFTSLALPGAEAESFHAEVERRIADRGVAERVTLTGWLPGSAVSELLSAADAVVLPFTQGVTTKSGSLLAAFAHGSPVLATVADDPDPELVDGQTFVTITRRRDAAAIAAAVHRRLEDPATADRVAAGGLRLAAARTWPAIAAAHARIYARVLGRR